METIEKTMEEYNRQAYVDTNLPAGPAVMSGDDADHAASSIA